MVLYVPGVSRVVIILSGVCLKELVSVNVRSLHKARFPFKRNRLRCVRCVRCVNENRKKRKRLRWQAANHGCHCYDRAFLLAAFFLRFSFTQRTHRKQRKRLRLEWMETGLYTVNLLLVTSSELMFVSGPLHIWS